jgi:periplasmic divalent cation tolerance protein
MSDLIEVVTTTARKDEAETIARELVQRRLAACVQIVGPVTSVYRWQGSVEHSQEWMCRIKAPRDLYEQVAAAIRELHSYETPEIIAQPVLAADEQYEAWAVAQTSEQTLKVGGQSQG